MYPLFVELSNLESSNFARFMREVFLVREKFFQETETKLFVMYHRQDLLKYDEIKQLEQQLQKTFNFPAIDYLLALKHTCPQPIHTDGVSDNRYSSLNLALSGAESSQLTFYLKKNDSVHPRMVNDRRYDEDDVIPIYSLKGTNHWTLINSNVPHSVNIVDESSPKITMAFRFFGNPTFDELYVKCSTALNCKHL